MGSESDLLRVTENDTIFLYNTKFVVLYGSVELLVVEKINITSMFRGR